MNVRAKELKAGLFVLTGALLFIAALLSLGENSNLLTRAKNYYCHFHSVDGLMTGAKVVLSGIQVGTVEDISIDPRTNDVAVKLAIQDRFSQWLRTGSTAEMATMGVLGDKFIKLTRGNTEGALITAGNTIPSANTQDLSQVLNKGDSLLVTLNSIAGGLDKVIKGFEKGNRSERFADNLAIVTERLASVSQRLDKELEKLQLAEAVKNLNSILQKINDGHGTLGALINDPGLYDDAKALVGGANRNRIVRNMVRETIKQESAAPSK
jgi:phospholipid/cholesterol/gamma-HCH transport system substrate-binding protein